MSDLKRRDFIKGAAVTAAAGSCVCASSGCKMIVGKSDAPEISADAYMIEGGNLKIELESVPSLAKIGGSAKLTEGGLPDPLMIARVGEDEFLVTSIECTHGGRELEYIPEEGNIRCTSFSHSTFSKTGEVLDGPAEGPIEVYKNRKALLDRSVLIVFI